MRTMMFAFLSAMMLIVAGAVGQGQRSMPLGDYHQTCRDINMNGSRLQARCQDHDGNWRNTSLDYRDCQGSSVINDDGRLRCGSGQGQGFSHGNWAGGLPPGDYKQTCRNMRVSGDRLEASCQTRNGGWRNTSLKGLDHCNTRIVNDNGHLKCD